LLKEQTDLAGMFGAELAQSVADQIAFQTADKIISAARDDT